MKTLNCRPKSSSRLQYCLRQPKTIPRQARDSQDDPKTSFKHAQDTLIQAQDGPRWDQTRLRLTPKAASRHPPGPKRAQDSSRTDPRRPQTSPDPPKTNPRQPKRGPRQAQTHPRQAQDSLKPVQKDPTMGRYPVYLSPEEPQSPLFDAAQYTGRAHHVTNLYRWQELPGAQVYLPIQTCTSHPSACS